MHRKIYLILNPTHSPCQVVFASLSKIKRDNVYEYMSECCDLECAEAVNNEIHADLVEEDSE
jgi:hypothetical protein